MSDTTGHRPDAAPTLTDGTVTLRGRSESDVEGMLALARDPETLAWTTVPDPYSRADALVEIGETAPRGWADGSALCWAVEAPDGPDRRFAGHVELRPGQPPEVSYALAPWARGRGLAVRALRLAADWAFGLAGFEVLHWAATAGHLASWRVAHACGFTFEGTRTLAHPSRDGLVDSWHAVLRPDSDRRAPATTWWPVPVLAGERVRLRPFTEADVPRIVEARSDERSRYFSARLRAAEYPAEQARRWLREMEIDGSLGGAVHWVIADPADDRLLGYVAVFGMDRLHAPHGGEIGYWAHPDARGRGVVTEAVRLARDHAFTPTSGGGLGRTLLILGAAADNPASRSIAERAGFRLIGRFRDGGVLGVHNELVADGVWYDLLPDDPTPDRPGGR